MVGICSSRVARARQGKAVVEKTMTVIGGEGKAKQCQQKRGNKVKVGDE